MDHLNLIDCRLANGDLPIAQPVDETMVSTPGVAILSMCMTAGLATLVFLGVVGDCLRDPPSGVFLILE